MKLPFKPVNFSTRVNYPVELLSGLTVAFALMPEAMAFAMIAGLSPLTGLYTAFTMGFITAAFGGRPGMISGAAGATAIVIIGLVKSHGAEYLFAAVIMAGIIQIIAKAFRLGRFIQLVPTPVMLGFVNGLAIIIFISQLAQFKVAAPSGTHWLTGPPLYTMLGLAVLTIFIIWLVPKLTKSIPSSLVAVVVIYLVCIVFKIPSKTIGDIAKIKGGFPPLHIPHLPLTLEIMEIIFPFALIIAGVGTIESLLTVNLIDEKTETRGNGSKELLAQGAANIVTGLFSGMGGCAMIGQSMINISSGARTRVSGITASIMVLVFIMFASAVIEKVPVAALTGIMIMVAVKTFEWSTIKMFGKMPAEDILIVIVVTGITVFFNNLAMAVIIGTVLSAVVFSWKSSGSISLAGILDASGVKNYIISGPLYFGSVSSFQEQFDVHGDPEEITIDLQQCRVFDMSGVLALNKVTERYYNAGKVLSVINLAPESEKLFKKAGSTVKINIIT